MREDRVTGDRELCAASQAGLTSPGPGQAGRGMDAIQAWLVSTLAELLGIERHEVDVTEPFASYGLGSTELVGLSGELGEWLGRTLPADLAYECPTIDALARRLADRSGALPAVTDTSGARTADEEPIAIIGIGCRFPGAKDPWAFWDLLRNGVDAIREVPADRFDVHAFLDPDPAAPGKIVTRWGGFIDEVDQFDPHFFGISPREAARMDPQQRLLLEVTWEALEDAGLARERLAGTSAGVFIGISNNDYGRTQFDDLDHIDAYAGTGNALSIAANRISYVFDFRGPSIAIDTACSSSLVAVHQACASLRSGESAIAVTGGVNLILSPAITINFTKAGAMAPDGRCKAFDARANGYVRSEGAGVVVLKPLSRALADHDPIYAVIRGSAVNQDGRSNGLMAPNPLAQEAVLREAYRRARVSPADLQYVEAHGTGTLLGDPIEAKALGAVLELGRSPERPCLLGSVKTNVGHLEAAAGIAGLIKVALALRHLEVPASLHFEEANPHIPFDRLPLRVNTSLAPWPVPAGAALAGVSSFGFGGTNAHVVLQQAPQPAAGLHAAEGTGEDRAARSTYLLPLSARSPVALQALARGYRGFLTDLGANASPSDVCYSASVRRSHHEYRLAVTGDSAAQLAAGLDAFLRGELGPGISSGRKLSDRKRKVVFVFPGQGGQWLGMGRRLLAEEPVFRRAIERCDQAMRPLGDWSLLTELMATNTVRPRLNEIDVLQPALFAIQVALTTLWRSWGIEPHAVVGHSMGEVAAAHVAGALSLEAAARVICGRSRLVKPTIGQGAMAAVELSVADAERALAGYEDRVSVAVSNGMTSTVLSGDPAALETIVTRLQRRDVFCRMINVDFAAHSPQMEPIRGALERALDGLQPGPASVPIYSTLTGRIADGSSFDSLYWGRNLREPVLFSSALQQLMSDGHDVFLEISPHPVLLGSIQQDLRRAGMEGAVLPSLRRDEDDGAALGSSLGALYTLGHSLEWGRIYPDGGRFVPLPSYPWQRERCWFDASTRTDDRSPRASYAGTGRHSLLGRHFTSASAGTHYWETALEATEMNDHRVEGVAVLSAARIVEMALAAGGEVLPPRSFVLTNVEFRRALFLADGASAALQLVAAPEADGGASVHIYGKPQDRDEVHRAWTLHATGTIRPRQELGMSLDLEENALAAVQDRCAERMSGEDYYLKLRSRGVEYGASLQSITRLWGCEGEILGEVNVPGAPLETLDASRCHPALLDACFQTFAGCLAARAAEHDTPCVSMPTRADEIRIHGQPGQHLWSHARLRTSEAGAATGDVRLLDETGQVMVEVLGLRFESLARIRQDDLDDWLYELRWLPREPAEAAAAPALEPSLPGTWLIFADRAGVGEALTTAIHGAGGRSVVITPGRSYERPDDAHASIDPERPEDAWQLLSTFAPGALRGIVHLWSLDAPPPEQTTVTSLQEAQRLGSGAVLHLSQALGRLAWPSLPRLWLVTSGAQPAGEEALLVDAAQAPLWGLGRVMAHEHPMSWGGLVDLDPRASHVETARSLWQQISAPDGEDQVAFRQGRRYAARLMRRARSRSATPSPGWRSDGTYLITGGLGDLGLSVAHWMVEQGARRLILLARTQLPPRALWSTAEAGSPLAHRIAAIRELEALGASVHLASVDVADERELARFLDRFRDEGWPPIRGVVHAAGVLQDGLLMQLDAAALQSVLRPKMLGSWLLHRLLEDAALDFFVLFSSAGSLLGQPGQGNYAAANAFLDALAHHRRARGQRALSINWGAWSELGFANTAGGKRLAERLASLGVTPLAPSQALKVLEGLLRQGCPQVAAVPVDWSRYRQFYAATNPPLLSELAAAGTDPRPDGAPPSETRSTLMAAAPAQRQELLQTYLSERVARVLGTSASAIDAQQPLSNLGLDSLMAVELQNRIAADLGVNVPMVTLLSGPSIDQAVSALLDLLSSSTSSPADSSGPSADTDEDALAELSDEAVSSMLADLLGKQEAGE